MKLSDFDFNLPKELIATKPSEKRSDSRLMVLKGQSSLEHAFFQDLKEHLQAGDVLVLNESKVLPARIFATKPNGGKLALLLERVSHKPNYAWFQIQSKRKLHVGTEITTQGGLKLQLLRKAGRFWWVFSPQSIHTLLDDEGAIPLPPYMSREAESFDEERYQTVYAKNQGSVAAPTAGLHFEEDLLLQLEKKGILLAYLTLHVGSGTFLPVQKENIEEHIMHTERYAISKKSATTIHQALLEKRRVIAVGTTSLRALESIAIRHKGFQPIEAKGHTKLFIRGSFRFQVVSGMVTNFHTPKSSLLMLVSSLMGYETMKKAYQIAIKKHYRFFSYGDAMLLLREHEHVC